MVSHWKSDYAKFILLLGEVSKETALHVEVSTSDRVSSRYHLAQVAFLLNPTTMSNESYTKIPNALLEFILSIKGEAGLKVSLFACRKIYGFHKKADKLSISQIIKGTSLSKNSAIRGVQSAINHGVLTRIPSGLSFEYTISNSFNQKLVPNLNQCKKETGANNAPELVPNLHQQVVPNLDTQKKYIKERKKETVNGEEVLSPCLSVKRIFTDLWCSEWQKAFGTRYDFHGAADGKAADSLLDLGIPPERIIEIAKKAWSNQSLFWCKKAVTLRGFASRLTEVRQEIGDLKPIIEPKTTADGLNISQKSSWI